MINEYFKTLACTEGNKEQWKQQVEVIKETIESSNNEFLRSLKVYEIMPYMFYFRLDALDEKDYPHNIDMNSIYLTFKVDFVEGNFELVRNGSVYLSKKDLKTEMYKYLAMKSVVRVLIDYGMGKKFRKSKYKDAKQAANKMLTYFDSVMKAVNVYTGGYPYEKGIEE